MRKTNPKIEEVETTDKIYRLKEKYTVKTIEGLTGISKKGIFNKLRSSRWTKAEMFLIDHLSKKYT